MSHGKVIDELRKIRIRRGEPTKEQRKYAMIEENTIAELCPSLKRSEEVRYSHLRTLDKYLSEHMIKKILRERGLN